MGMCDSPSPPRAPDPNVTAAAQSAANADTARLSAQLNRVNQYGPQGSTTYSRGNGVDFDVGAYLAANPDVAGAIQNGTFKGSAEDHYRQNGVNENRQGVPAGYDPNARDTWSQTTTLSPEQQHLYDLQTRAQTTYGEAGNEMLDRTRSTLAQPLNMDGLPEFSAGNAPAGVNWSIADAGPIQRQIGDTQQGIRYDFADTGDAQQILRDIGGPQRNMGAPADFAQDRSAVEQALYARLNPQLDRDRAALETRLANQGIGLGSEAWRTAMDDSNRQSNDARLAVTAAGLQEQQGLYGMAANRFGAENAAQNQEVVQALGANQQAYGQELGRGQFANEAQAQDFGQMAARADFANRAQDQLFGQNTAQANIGNAMQSQTVNQDLARTQLSNGVRQQGMAERLALRNQPLNEVAAMLSGQQVQMPQFGSAPQIQVAPTDVLGAYNTQYQGQLAGYNGQVATQNANTGALAGVLGTAGGLAAAKYWK